MKKTINIRYIPLLLFLTIIMAIACESTADTYSEFTKDGEKIYVGTADTVILAHGFEKLQFSVVINADPKITKGTIQTKDQSISHDFEIVRKNMGKDTVVFSLDLEEGEYNFDLILKDNAGNQSIPREVNAMVYGSKYSNSLISRRIKNMSNTPDSITLEWDNAPLNCISTTFSFEDAEGNQQTIEIANEEMETVLDSYTLGSQFTISSSFKPQENAIETFNSLSEDTFPDKFALDHTQITALRLPFDASDGCHGSTYERLTDGSTGEYWHSCDSPEDQYPWVMSFDLGVTAMVKGFKLNERAECCGGRSPKAYQIWGINDLSGTETVDIDAGTITEWEVDAVAKGWVKLLEVTDNNETSFSVDIPDNTTNYRYIRIVGISSINGEANANFNEFTFFASQVE